jgi:hypothetical protein
MYLPVWPNKGRVYLSGWPSKGSVCCLWLHGWPNVCFVGMGTAVVSSLHILLRILYKCMEWEMRRLGLFEPR